MKIRYRKEDEFKTPESRASFSEFVSATVEGKGKSIRFSPYKPDEWDDSFWTVDSGNDWKIKFIDAQTVEVVHRYQNKDAIASLAKWLAYRTGGKIVDETPNELHYLRDESMILNAMLGVNWNASQKKAPCLAGNTINELIISPAVKFVAINDGSVSCITVPYHVIKQDGEEADFKYCIPVAVFDTLALSGTILSDHPDDAVVHSE